MTGPKTIAALLLCCALAACGGRDRPGSALPSPEFAGDIVSRNAIAKQLFGAEDYASRQSPAPIGFYSKGCLAGAAQLPETGPTWQAMRLSRNRNWGHPDTIAYIERLSRKAAQLPGWNGLYVGDISQPRGGPMASGHASHQIGLDADIWLRPATDMNLSRAEREKISSISMRRSNGAFTNSNWTRAHHELLKAAASDPAVARIFIFPGAKVQMCKDEKGDRSWLNKIRPWYGHHYHFHVRLKCPRGAANCETQAPQPAGDGCADAQDWVNNILNPPPPKPRDPNAPKPKPKRELTLADLPRQCQAVLSP
ncbi:penicillin-insensitive murein endopeptidase [Oceaniglobus roseus]|uniref:penicillin-insensitive murein endopeptidase n=1 Tax=Oceaniglobus roseus TaxID=1737570 RepID=UPI000C7F3017|nr:penicillin-insensitive murein endopeptidase [Kandeliimicrobium roseum]